LELVQLNKIKATIQLQLETVLVFLDKEFIQWRSEIQLVQQVKATNRFPLEVTCLMANDIKDYNQCQLVTKLVNILKELNQFRLVTGPDTIVKSKKP
jgi:hypothetical protein